MRRPAPLPGDPAPPAPASWEERRSDAAEASSAADDATQEVADTHEPELRSRDVWQAARARRRALRAEIRRFTKGTRRRRMIWIGSVGAVLALVAGCVAAAYSPLFAVERITVTGASALDPAVVEAALAGQLGTPLALVDDSAVKAALMTFPLIETYSLEARPPHDLTVRILERTPVGVIDSAGGFTLVDAAGVLLATLPQRPAGQPLLEIAGGTDSSAFASAGAVIRSVPAGIRDQLVTVTASSADDVTLHLTSGTTVVWGSDERSPYKAKVLEAAMAARPDAARYDVSSPDAVVVG